MGWSSSVATLVTGAVYRATGWESAGRRLVQALDSEDPNTQQIAGMSLVQRGEESRPLLQDALTQGMDGIVAEVLEDLDESHDVGELRTLARSDNPRVARAARIQLEKRGIALDDNPGPSTA